MLNSVKPPNLVATHPSTTVPHHQHQMPSSYIYTYIMCCFGNVLILHLIFTNIHLYRAYNTRVGADMKRSSSSSNLMNTFEWKWPFICTIAYGLLYVNFEVGERSRCMCVCVCLSASE